MPNFWVRRVSLWVGIVVCIAAATPLRAADDAPPATSNQVYQYFVPGPTRRNLGAYLWVPPQAKIIRGVMVGIHNGLPQQILQHPAVRRVCAENGIAQILMTPWSKDIGAMLKDLNFDITDPKRTDIYDYYLEALADASSHPELLRAPVIPLAHSAFCSFPFDVALRNPGRCLMAIPIKAGLPSIYQFYKVGGKSLKPAPQLNMAHVPILFCTSMNQSTVPGNWKSKPLPYVSGTNGHPFTYRDDTLGDAGDAYRPGNEMFGLNWEMMSCHFDMSEREYTFIAQYIDAICKLRLPAAPVDTASDPILKPLTLSSGWLVDGFFSNWNKPGAKYYPPAPYAEYQGPRNKAYWYPTEELARTMEQRMVREGTKKFEIFTIQDRKGEPMSLAESPQVTIPHPEELLEDDGRFTLRPYHYSRPPMICTNMDPKHVSDPAAHHLENVLFPGQTEIPISARPVRVDLNGSPVELVAGTEFTFRLHPHRLAPDAGGSTGACLRFYQEGDEEFAWSGRNVWIAWAPNGQKIAGIQDQTITFPAVADVPRSTRRVKLSATASSGQRVEYFVLCGPAVVQGDELVITQLPVADPKPIGITVGAYQVGVWKQHGFKAAETVYRTFSLLP